MFGLGFGQLGGAKNAAGGASASAPVLMVDGSPVLLDGQTITFS